MRLDVGRKYTYAELAVLRDDPEMAAWAMKGYVWRQDLDGTMQLVHWSKASQGGGSFGQRPDKPLMGFAASDDDLFDEANLPPIVRRTPQQRVASLTARIEGDMKAGRVLSDDKMKLYVPTWRKGKEMAGEDVKEVASAFLQGAENRKKD